MIELQSRRSVSSPMLKNVHFQAPISQNWKKNSIVIIATVFQFINKMTQQIHSFQFRNLNNSNFKALNDKSSYFRFYVNQGYINHKLTLMVIYHINIFKDKIKYWFNANIFLNKVKTSYRGTIFSMVINPNNTFKIVFDALLLILLIFNVAFAPVSVCFVVTHNPLLEILLIQLPNYSVLLTIILTFNTAYYDSGVLKSSRKQIGKNYLKTNFWYDSLSMLPMLFNIYQGSLVYFLVLFRLSLIFRLNFQFEENFNLRKNYGTYIDVAKLMSIFLFASHMFACIFFYIGSMEIQNGAENTWIQVQKLEDTPWTNQYINAMYWGSVTTLTIGYGDITPTTETERAYVILVAVMSSVVFGFTISNIGQIFNSIAEKNKNQRDKMSIITSFIQKRGLNKLLEIKVKKFFEYYFQMEENRDQECELLIQNLTEDLRNEVKIDFYKKYLKNSGLITSTFSDEFIDQACLLMQESLLIPEEKLLFKNEKIEQLCFIIEGSLDLYIEANNDRISVIRSLKHSQSIAQTYFLTGKKVPYSIKSTQFTRIAQLDREKFNQLLQQYPADWQRFKKLQNQILLKECQQLHCEVCLQSHMLEECHVLFYQPSLKRVIKKNYQIKQERCPFFRQNKIRMKTFLDKLQIQEGLLSFGIDENFIQKEQVNEDFVIRCDLVRLRHAELNQEMRQRQITLLAPEEQEKFLKRRNGVKLSIKLAQDSLDSEPQSQKIIKSLSQDGPPILVDIQQQLYGEYLNTIKADILPHLDRYKEYDYFQMNENISLVLEKIKERVLLNQGSIKKSRRTIKKLTWIDCMSRHK